MSVLSGRGYGISKEAWTDAELAHFRESLTVKPITVPGYGPEVDGSFPCYRESARKMYLPRGWAFEHLGAVSEVRPEMDAAHATPLSPALRFTGMLRGPQEEPVKRYLEAARDPLRGGGLLCLYAGFGKTVCALHIVAALGVKTVVLVHKEFLMKQWEARIAQYLPGAKVGRVQGKCVEVEGADVIMCMLQSVSMKTYPPETWAGVGLMIVDECHHVGAEVFSRALYQLQFPYTLGLSATPTRKDGMTKVIKWYLGDMVYKGKKSQDSGRVLSHVFENPEAFRDREQEYSAVPLLFHGKVNLSRCINQICGYAPRTEWIVQKIVEIKEAEPRRFVLVLTDRRAHLTAIHKRLTAIGSVSIQEVGYYVGGMKSAELTHVEDHADVILATYAMAAEGMDIPKLNTLVLASPKSDVEQAVGRIQRQKPEDREHDPLVIDVVDDFCIFPSQSKKRQTYYKKIGLKIIS